MNRERVTAQRLDVLKHELLNNLNAFLISVLENVGDGLMWEKKKTQRWGRTVPRRRQNRTSCLPNPSRSETAYLLLAPSVSNTNPSQIDTSMWRISVTWLLILAGQPFVHLLDAFTTNTIAKQRGVHYDSRHHRQVEVKASADDKVHIVLYTGVEDLRVEDHDGLWTACEEATRWTAVLGLDEMTSLRKAAVKCAARELERELFVRYGGGLTVMSMSEAIRLNGTVAHIVSGANVDGRTWSAELRDDQYDGKLCFEKYKNWAASRLRRQPRPAPEEMPEYVELASSRWELLDGPDYIQFEEPYAELAIAKCGCRTSKQLLHEYLQLGRDAFAARYFSRAGGQSLYAAAAQWVAGDAPAERLAVREPAERAFGAALAVGGISKRMLAAAAAGKGATFPPRLGKVGDIARSSQGALLDVAEWRQWYDELKQRRNHDRWWTWGSAAYPIRYVEYQRATKGRLALFLIHGFGASADQWQRLANEFANLDVSVFAVDLIGFGYSAKPGISYTQHLWENMLEEFTRQVVLKDHDRCVLVGNSIGGGLAAGLSATLGPSLCAGLVLCNTAGNILDKDSPEDSPTVRELTLNVLDEETTRPRLEPFSPPPGRQLLIDAFGQVVIDLLKPQIPSLLARYYPTNPDNADEHLATSIARAANDPGAAIVIASGAKLPPQRSLNEVLREYGGPVLVPQGQLDYVSGPERAVLRASQLASLRPDITVKLLESGHCPHDESPGLVADELKAWLPSIKGGS